VVIPDRVVSRPAEIPSIAFNAVMKAGNLDSNVYPQIIDSSYQRKLSDVIRQQSANKPILTGIKRLGWNDARHRFITPTWEARAGGIYPTSRIPFSTSEFLKHYNFASYSVTTSYENISKHTRYFLAILASGIIRSYLRLSLAPVYILRNSASIQLLHALFKPLGQVHPLTFGPLRRNVLNILNPANVSGYPVFGSTLDQKVMYGLQTPVILLSDNGLPYHEVMSDQEFAETASYAHFVITHLAMFCLQYGYHTHTMIKSEDEPLVEDMACEGKKIIEKACHIPEFDLFEPDMPHLQAVLAEVPYERMNEFFRYDMPSGKVYIRFRKFPGHSRNEVFLELSAKNIEVKNHGDFYIECPVDFMTDLLRRYFGKPIKLFHQASETQETTEGPDGLTQSLS